MHGKNELVHVGRHVDMDIFKFCMRVSLRARAHVCMHFARI